MKKRYLLVSILFLFVFANIAGCTAPSIKEAPSQKEMVENKYKDTSLWAYYEMDLDKEVDVFLIAPTVEKGSDKQFNMSLTNDEVKQKFLYALQMQRGLYDEHARMFAPYYQQAGLNVYSLNDTKASPYYEIAYKDVKEAFMYYMEHVNKGRPFILAGFSQGADMGLRLLKDVFTDKTNQKQMIAAYLLGWRITQEDLDEYPQLKMAQNEDDTGVIVSFNSEAEDIQSSIIVPNKTLGINPLNWKNDGTPASKEENKGACFFDREGNINKEIPGLTGAYLDEERGTLKVIDIKKEDYKPGLSIFEEGVFHLYDYQFFYKNIQENVNKRINVFLKSNKN